MYKIDLIAGQLPDMQIVVEPVREIDLFLKGCTIDLTLQTSIVQELLASLSGGVGVGGRADVMIANPVRLSGGTGVGGAGSVYLDEYVRAATGIGAGGNVNAVIVSFLEPAHTGVGVGGDLRLALTRKRLLRETDTLPLSVMDAMTIAELDYITLE